MYYSFKHANGVLYAATSSVHDMYGEGWTADGRVDNLRVTEAEPPGVFDREARRAASRWRFSPRRENGQPVPREATKTLYFRLQGRGR